jgi:hypothetical protein
MKFISRAALGLLALSLAACEGPSGGTHSASP